MAKMTAWGFPPTPTEGLTAPPAGPAAHGGRQEGWKPQVGSGWRSQLGNWRSWTLLPPYGISQAWRQWRWGGGSRGWGKGRRWKLPPIPTPGGRSEGPSRLSAHDDQRSLKSCRGLGLTTQPSLGVVPGSLGGSGGRRKSRVRSMESQGRLWYFPAVCFQDSKSSISRRQAGSLQILFNVTCQILDVFYRTVHRAPSHCLTRHSFTHPFPQRTGPPSFSGESILPPPPFPWTTRDPGKRRTSCVIPPGFIPRIP